MRTHDESGVLPDGGQTFRRFVLLWSLLVLARAFLQTVVPLQAYTLLGDAQAVSVFYFLASVLGVIGSLSIPWFLRHIRRRGVVMMAAAAMLCSHVLFATETVYGLAMGLLLQILAVSAFDVALNLYLMAELPRRQFAYFEPLRIFYSALAFAVGPVAGIWLARQTAEWVPFAVAAATVLCVLAIFFRLNWSEQPHGYASRPRRLNPLVYLPRFFRQPRLRLAYLLASARSGWWTMFGIYAPIFAVQSGFDSVFAGAVVSAGFSWLFLARLWGAAARLHGMRRILIIGYGLGGLATLSTGAVGDTPFLGIAGLLLAAFFMAALDGVGNVFFLRAVRPLERPEMTTAFSTYREAGQTIPPGVFAALLRVFELPVVFVASGMGLLLVGWYARYIPRRL
jgi:MFS family permease